MSEDDSSMDEKLRRLAVDYPLQSFNAVSCLTSTVRRMAAEKRLGIPIHLRSGFVVATKNGKSANQMTEAEWESFFCELREELRKTYPDIDSEEFPA